MITLTVPTITGTETHTVYEWNEGDLFFLREYPQIRKRRATYLNVPCAFDIEATTIDSLETPEPYAFIYQWQFCIDTTVWFGRSIETLQSFFHRISSYLYNMSLGILPIYVHFLSYEFQFIWPLFEWSDIFARTSRQPIRCRSNNLEFRCSYFLSNMSLIKFCENTAGVTHYKLTDTYDYRKIRTPETPLTEEELSYCFNDVYGLCECIRTLYIEDSCASIPLTSTGYVRRECRAAMKSNPKNRELFINQQLTLEQYKMCREAFRGGDTHANHYYTGEVITDLESNDLSSSYPAQMLCKKYPMTKFITENASNFGHISPEYCYIARIKLLNVRLKPSQVMPYIDVAHCRNIVNARRDNGRILSAEHIEITVTDVDWDIISNLYTYDELYCKDLITAKYDYLPKELREVILNYFVLKSQLKNVQGKEYEYIKSKNKLNAIYGMMVCDILQPELEFSKGMWINAKINEKNVLEHYYKNRNSFLSYQWGVWITAHARHALYEVYHLIGKDNVYQDTDCIKAFEGHQHLFDEYNRNWIKSYQHLDIKPEVTVNGKTYIMGIWDYEGHIDEFITFGSKKYCFKHRGQDGYTVTVSGLNKKKASALISSEGISEFKIGKVFTDSGRTQAIYDTVRKHTVVIDGCKITVHSFVATLDTTYTLGITDEYANLCGLSIDTSEIL